MSELEQRLTRLLGGGAWLERFERLKGFRFERIAAFRFDDGKGLPPALLAAERVGAGLAWFATLFIAVVGAWEIAGPIAAGHYASATAVAVGGENMLRWGVIAPVAVYTGAPPTPADFYCHHPFGLFWTAALCSWLFGHHFWVCRLPAVLMSVCMPRLIYGAGRAMYGPFGGGLAALGYVVLPITLAYANYFSLEVATLFGMALATYGYARFVQSERRRFAVLAVLGLGYAAACDWTGFAFDALILGGLFLRGFVLRRVFAPLAFTRFAGLWAWSIVVVGGLALFHLAALVKLEHVNELLRQGEFRTAGSEQPLSSVLDHRRYWIALAFTPLAITIGKLGLPVLLSRLLLRRRELELFPLAVLATASAQYLVFKQGADIHFFWPQYFALYFAYAVGAVVTTLELWLGWASGRRSIAGRSLMPGRALAPWLVGAVGLVSVLAIVPDGLRALVYARKSGGRFNERGAIIYPDFDKEAALAAFAELRPDGGVFGVPNSMRPSYWMDWVLRRPVRYLGLPRVGGSGVAAFALDARFDTRGAIETLTREFPVHAVGPILIAETEQPPAPTEGFAALPRRLGALEAFFTATSHDVYDIVSDPFWTWELRTHLSQTPNPEPLVAPRTNEQRRIAYNVAVFEHDRAAAERWSRELFAGVDRSVARSYTEGVELLGARLERGASTRLTLYFRASAPLLTDTQFQLVSLVESPPRWSLVPKDELPWDVGMPFALPTTLWQPAFIYSTITELTPRPGRENYDGGFRGPIAPTQTGGQRGKPLLTLP